MDLHKYQEKILTIVGVSNDGLYVDLDVHTARQVNDIFKYASESGVSKENVVNPKFKESLFKGDEQFIHLHGCGYNNKQFFSQIAVDTIKKHYGLN